MKTKLRGTRERYSKIHVPFKFKTNFDCLSKNRSICIMRQDKGRGVVVMDRSKYTEKCLNILQTEQFTKLRHDSTMSIENKIQWELRKLKTRLTMQEYRQLYPTGSKTQVDSRALQNYVSSLLMTPSKIFLLER